MLQEFLDRVFRHRTPEKVEEARKVAEERAQRVAEVVNPNRAIIEEIHKLERRAARRG